MYLEGVCECKVLVERLRVQVERGGVDGDPEFRFVVVEVEAEAGADAENRFIGKFVKEERRRASLFGCDDRSMPRLGRHGKKQALAHQRILSANESRPTEPMSKTGRGDGIRERGRTRSTLP